MSVDVTCGCCENQFPVPEGAEGPWFTCPHCGYQSAKEGPRAIETRHSTSPGSEAGGRPWRRSQKPGKQWDPQEIDEGDTLSAAVLGYLPTSCLGRGCLGMILGAVIGFVVMAFLVGGGVGGTGTGPGIPGEWIALAIGAPLGAFLGGLVGIGAIVAMVIARWIKQFRNRGS
jgi:hypothetical protein